MKNEIEAYFYPILAMIGNESMDSIMDKWDRFDALSEIDQEKISSISTAKKIRSISNSLKLDPAAIPKLSIAIRNYYFNELKLEDFPFYLAKEISLELSKAKEITTIVLREIINDDSIEKELQQNIISMPLSEALEKIPVLNDQLVTTDRIRISNSPDPVRPSIKNWITDYVSVFGYEKIDAVQIGKYLFQGENAKKLNFSDRQKLNHIIKSFNDGTPVSIDKKTQTLVFPKIQEPIQASRPSAPQNFTQKRATEFNTQKQPIQAFAPTRTKMPSQRPVQAPMKTNSPVQNLPFGDFAPKPVQKDQDIPRVKPQPQTPVKKAFEENVPKASFSSAIPPQKIEKNDQPTRKVSFSSPQKLSSEKFQPYRITPFSSRAQSSSNDQDKRAAGKNVVNLKEN